MARGSFGNVRKLKSGNWQARFVLPGTGQRIKAPHTFSTKGAAVSWLNEQKYLLDKGVWVHPDDVAEEARKEAQAKPSGSELLFETWADRYVDYLTTVRSASENTIVDVKSSLSARILPTFKGRDVTTITPGEVERWYKMLRAELAPSTAFDRYSLLKRVLALAVEAEVLDKNPCRLRIVKDKAEGNVTDERVATPEQVKKLAACMDPRFSLTILLAAWCALRQGEILGLRRKSFKNLDTDHPTVLVDRQIISKTGNVGRTKNGESRELSIPLALVPVIESHLASNVADGLDAPVFPTRPKGGRAVHNNNLRERWWKARNAAEMPDFKFHDLRHTGLTLFAQQGATYAELLHRGGHKDIEVALKYQHWSMERDRALTAKLDGLISESLGMN